MKPQLTAERARELLDYDPLTGKMTWRVSRGPRAPKGSQAGCATARGYRSVLVDGNRYLVHRIAWLLVHGRFPAADTDHINGCRADNRLANLREATRQENSRNRRRRSDNESGFKGVGRAQRKHIQLGFPFSARIRVGGKQRCLGFFRTAVEAHQAYVNAARRHFGEFFRAA